MNRCTNVRCDAYHDGHDCNQPGACRLAMLAMLARIDARPRMERQRAGSVRLIWPDNPRWHA